MAHSSTQFQSFKLCVTCLEKGVAAVGITEQGLFIHWLDPRWMEQANCLFAQLLPPPSVRRGGEWALWRRACVFVNNTDPLFPLSRPPSFLRSYMVSVPTQKTRSSPLNLASSQPPPSSSLRPSPTPKSPHLPPLLAPLNKV